MSLQVVPLTLQQANDAIETWHRHHKKCLRHRYSIGAVKDSRLVGVAIMGRPVARMCDLPDVIEVNRLATDGTRNACSFLLGTAAKIAKCMGFAKIQTYTLVEESGSSLRGAGWTLEVTTQKRGGWVRSDKKARDMTVLSAQKYRWAKYLNTSVTYTEPEKNIDTSQLAFLW